MYAHLQEMRVRFTERIENMSIYENISMALLFSFLTGVGAKLKFYLIGPVPFTLQTFFVISSGMFLKREWATLSMIIYLLMGVFGIPVFAGNSAGIEYFLGPTAGYLLGFLIAPYFVSSIFRKSKFSWKGGVLSGIIGSLIILGVGTAFLAIYLGNIFTAFIFGFLPFLPWELVKGLGAATISKSMLGRYSYR